MGVAKKLLFDGESGLRSKQIQNAIYKKYKLKIHAEAYFKRNLVERMIKEIKIRLAIILSLEGNKLATFSTLYLCYFFYAGLALHKWRDYLSQVVSTINMHQKHSFKSINNMMIEYFTRKLPTLPQNQTKFYKFNLGETVGINVTPAQRRSFSFKYSLHFGKYTKTFYYNTILNKFCAGKLQKITGLVKKRQLLVKNNVMFPHYTVHIPALDKVKNKFITVTIVARQWSVTPAGCPNYKRSKSKAFIMW